MKNSSRNTKHTLTKNKKIVSDAKKGDEAAEIFGPLVGVTARLTIPKYTINPYWSSSDKLLAEADSIENPSKTAFVATKINKQVFAAKAKIAYANKGEGPFKTGYSWWTSGMGSHITENLIILTDGTDDELYVGYFLRDETKYPMLLGKMDPQCPLAKEIKKEFAKFLGKEVK